MKTYDFFAYLNRMKYIERWSLMRSTVKENIMEHSEQVAQLAHALATINNVVFGGTVDVGAVVIGAVYHESSEVITGDLPTPIKYYNSDINHAYKNLEAVATKKLLAMIPEELEPSFSRIFEEKDLQVKKFVKAADKLAAYIKCIEETSLGNKDFEKAKNAAYKELLSYDMPEIDYFFKHFIDGFEKTLDDIT